MRHRALFGATLAALLPSVLMTTGAGAAIGPRAAHPRTQRGEIDVVQAAGHSHDLWVITDISNGDYNVARLHHGVWHTLPATPARGNGQLFGITAPTSSAVWVAGEVHPHGDVHPAIFRWNGAKLVSQKLPKLVLDHGGNPTIDSISAATAKDGWAVSDAIFARRKQNGHPAGPVALHWNGERWKSVRTPRPLETVVDLQRGNAWAIAKNNDLYHWNGKTWKLGYVVPSADELRDISASSPHNIVAVGDNNANNGDSEQVNGTYILHYNGKKWSRMSVTPKLRTPLYVTAVTVTAKSAWAIASQPSNFGLASVVLHDSGGTWRIQQKLDANHYLADVTASSARRVFAGGNASGADVGGTPTFLERYRGKHWKQISSKFSVD